MQIITYSVRYINSNGRVIEAGTEQFLDSIPIKKVQASVAERSQRAVDNVIVTEVSRVQL
ncbi:hypothetical protein IVIADoCa7_23 [Xanthomonas phage vB_Xar_IVIA-DoCa7]|uniref:Uncharacterized protein n=1 Tax=Xanthomonas phage vB_Xar_IVIA-DoCa7 TaxID=2975534 RepID=A0A9X9JNF8_9CAUD|nr:hypothetical protein IVIADoCa7_23 [Xanthomonas phage vB_Xar_IVIA-DoCa7]